MRLTRTRPSSLQTLRNGLRTPIRQARALQGPSQFSSAIVSLPRAAAEPMERTLHICTSQSGRSATARANLANPLQAPQQQRGLQPVPSFCQCLGANSKVCRAKSLRASQICTLLPYSISPSRPGSAWMAEPKDCKLQKLQALRLQTLLHKSLNKCAVPIHSSWSNNEPIATACWQSPLT